MPMRWFVLVLRLENAPPKLIGYCSSWGLQVAPGVFVAVLPARVRDEMWIQVLEWSRPETSGVLLFDNSGTEQGLEVRTLGSPRRRVVEREGLWVSTWIPLETPEQAP